MLVTGVFRHVYGQVYQYVYRHVSDRESLTLEEVMHDEEDAQTELFRMEADDTPFRNPLVSSMSFVSSIFGVFSVFRVFSVTSV